MDKYFSNGCSLVCNSSPLQKAVERGRGRRTDGRTDGPKPRRRQNAIEENRGRFSPQIATGARGIKTCLTARSLAHPITHSLTRSLLPSFLIPSFPSLPQVT